MSMTGTNVAALWMLLLACTAHAQSSKRRGNHVTNPCNTTGSPCSTKGQAEVEGILEPCLSAAQGEISATPKSRCCEGIASLDASCLCHALEVALGFTILGIYVNSALAIPYDCGYPVPRNCVCAGRLVPSPSLY